MKEGTLLPSDPLLSVNSAHCYLCRKGSLSGIRMTAGVGQAPMQGFMSEEAKWERALYRPHMLYAGAM